MYFDEAVKIYGNEIGAILISPTGCHFPIATKLKFPYTNSTTEYEACITSLTAALDMSIKHLEVYGGSILIKSQSIAEYEPHN